MANKDYNIEDSNMYDELTNLKNRLKLVLEQRNRYWSRWERLSEYVKHQAEINPSNHQYKKILSVMGELEGDFHTERLTALHEVYEKAKLFDEILDDCVMYGIGDTDTIKTTQDIFEDYMKKEGLL